MIDSKHKQTLYRTYETQNRINKAKITLFNDLISITKEAGITFNDVTKLIRDDFINRGEDNIDDLKLNQLIIKFNQDKLTHNQYCNKLNELTMQLTLNDEDDKKEEDD